MNAVCEQLEFDFDLDNRVGCLSEAREIFEAMGDRWETGVLPEGWTEVGDGSTRVAYLSPSGIVYKVCKEYSLDWLSENAHEYANFKEIKERGLLPKGWHVPRANLYDFTAFYTQWTGREPEKKWGRVDVLACEYIPGEECLLSDDEVDVVFSQVGLGDPTILNAKIHEYTKEFYIIDAGELVDRWPAQRLAA